MSTESITVRGARVHNLKNIDFEIQHNTLTVVTGVSGSGKSSLAFDTIYAEEDFPDPDTPVTTVSVLCWISKSIFLRL